ncbi:MAG: membrane protein insertion efficiency factor YidD [Patescibacteria group bacterium]
MTNQILWLIRFYQKTLSPDHGPLFRWLYPRGYCRFTPSCSEYGYQAIKKYGLLLGISKALWRVCRCNPWNKGGVDSP